MEELHMKRVFLLAVLALCLGLVVVGCRSKSGGLSDTSTGDTAKLAFLNNNVLFDFDRYNIRPDQVPVIDSKVAYLQDNASTSAVIQGHADERGTEAYNEALGDRRAKSAYNYLVNHGISASRLSTVSYGKDFPVDPAHNEDAWAKNRRAQFVLP
ncbi:MAG: OmpA family protein [Deltaproteobacteria bacterium]|jgi:peptidoglycan-associated lipoprotein|nr:OmpA family protein [Deltaproteobacteria bacterium]